MDPILSRNPYSELPLNGRSTCIRVLDLTPGTWNEDLQGTPRIVDLYSRPKYEALSYTWGNGNEREAIFLGHGCQLQITYNLFTALKRLRNLCSIRTVWADAVCINQSDAGEKSQQVPLMGEIYKTAENVLIWLGEYEHTSSRDRWRVIIPNLLWIFSRHWPRARNFKVAEMMESALRSSRPRWTDRAWVVQEFMLAQRVSLCFGPIVASIDRFDRDGCSIELFGRFPTQLNESTQSNKPYLRSLFDTISWYQMQKSSIKWLNITTTSLMTNGTECEDPRDKIYSVLSLIRSRQADYIQPDYSIPCSETYAKATFADITVEKCLDILALVAVKQPREPFDAQSTGRIPTWVPDFRANYRGTRVEEFYGFFFSHDFPSMHLPKVEASGCLSECAKHLTCSGFALGQVTNVLNVPLSEDLALSMKSLGSSGSVCMPYLKAKFRVPGLPSAGFRYRLSSILMLPPSGEYLHIGMRRQTLSHSSVHQSGLTGDGTGERDVKKSMIQVMSP